MHTIIIPIYNAQNSILDCVYSICRAARNSNIEIILIDDGSIDNSPVLCDDLAKEHECIRVIHTNNQGASAARNRGIIEAKGEWISFVDADDTISADYFSCFDSIENKADINYFGSHFISEDKNEIHLLEDKTYADWSEIEKGLLALKINEDNYEHYGYTWNKFFRASIIKKYNILFIEGLHYREDEIFTNNFILHSISMRTMPYIGYNYYYSKNGLSGQKVSREMYGVYAENAEKLLLKLQNEQLQIHELKYILSAYYKSFENETNNRIYLRNIRKMLAIIKKYNSVLDADKSKGYYSDILNYYKRFSSRRVINILMLKKFIKTIITM